MCARRFLVIVIILTLLVVGGAFAIFQLGDRVLVKQAVPKGHFKAPIAATGPDYSQAASWIARPDITGDPSHWLPEGLAPGEIASPKATVFYIHPTTYLERDRWNAPLDPGGDTAFRTNLFVQSQASAFNDVGEIWAPRYRQAAFGAFLLDSADAQKALDLAYGDVAAAFDAFLKANPTGPIILAGHSQGALHLERLLAEKVAGTPLARRIVAAYVVGWPVSTTADLPRMGLPACGASEQAGCVLSWMSFAEPANPNLILSQWKRGKGLNGGERRQSDILCVNPVNDSTSAASAPSDNPGTLVPTADLTTATLQPGLVGARCEKGLLIVGGAIPPLGPFVLPGNNYHVYDYALFWGAIRKDAERRLAAWQKR